jgi:ABC-2 type transport system ATP-binding protein
MENLNNPPFALEIKALSHSYGKRKALDDISFSVKQASFTVLLGLNGAGKSTLFSLMTRLYAAQTGSISIFGFDISKQSSEALRRLGVVFQARTLDLDLSLAQNLNYHAALHGLSAKETRARSEAALAQINLSDRRLDKVRDLSGGQMRRVEIVRALLHRPDMLLLDEPTVGLDIKARAEILSHVHKLVKEEGIGVLWATHLIDEIAEADDIVILHQGKLIDKGSVAEILQRSGTPDMAIALDKLTRPDPVREAK